jgi:hypothetical protein
MKFAIFILVFNLFLNSARCSDAASVFAQGNSFYRSGDYSNAVESFSNSSHIRPSVGALVNLGCAQWQQSQTGSALLAWEKALLLEPWNQAARNDLLFARKAAQVESPDLAWHEVVSSWLPMNGWIWVSVSSFWLLVAMIVCSELFHWRKGGWQNAFAAIGLTVLMLSLPAQWGIHTRARLGFVTHKDAPLLLTPTTEGQLMARLPSGEPARFERWRNGFVLVRTSRARGWLKSDHFALVVTPTRRP